MSEKKAKITLSGIGKGASSNAFMSFRFSPESEEIEEIIHSESDTRYSESAPASPKPTSGDVSPLKEYLLKEKHKWTNKWDKKSLSLDLDLKGKIKTAIEDKTKSLLSNFIPEETGVIPQSQSIPENFTTRVFSSSISEDNSSSSSGSGGAGPIGSSHNKNKHQNNSNDSSGNGSQETLGGESPDIFRRAMDHQEVEEIGVDMTDPSSVLDFEADSVLDKVTQWVFPPEELQEQFGEMPTLYQPHSLIAGIRPLPLEMLNESTNLPGGFSEGNSLHQSTLSMVEPSPPREDLSFSSLLLGILYDIIHHPWTKYWFAIAAGNVLLPLGFLTSFSWFLLGSLTVIIVGRGMTGADKDQNSPVAATIKEFKVQATRNSSISNVALPPTPVFREAKLPTKAQGWLTQMDGDYDVETCHFRQTKVVFVRIDGPNMYLAYPHSKHRIPKRRLWNDPPISMDHLFIQHKVYNISGAEINIVPTGLARKRVWNKKYPIEVTFPKWSMFYNVTPTPSTEVIGMFDSSAGASTSTPASTSVNYNVNAGVSVNKTTENSTKATAEKEILRQDCGMKSIYLFARCDREKDDWFRRLIAATKMGTLVDSYLNKSPPDPLVEYRDYMKRACPALIPLSQNAPEDYDNVSMPGEIIESSRASGPRGDKSTPSSSKKSTPEKEKATSNSKEDSIQSDIVNILSIPQSPDFFNALLGRLFYDFLKSEKWRKEVQKLVDKKLFFMKKPPFIEKIYVKELDLGSSIPNILRVSPPVLDAQGLWIDMDLVYDGNLCMTLETHVNLLKLGRKSTTALGQDENPGGNSSGGAGSSQQNKDAASGTKSESTVPSTSKNPPSPKVTPIPGEVRSHVFDSDADDSGESSDDEQDSEFDNFAPTANPNLNPEDPNVQTTSQKIMKFSEKIANSGFMNRPIVKKMVTSLGATPINMAVEIRSCIGTLTINIPPPPNDRVWLAFRTNPDIDIVAKPKFGERSINISQVTEWLKRKILLEFQRIMVCPNMTDITIPLMEFGLPK